jgi:hypothetical protein
MEMKMTRNATPSMTRTSTVLRKSLLATPGVQTAKLRQLLANPTLTETHGVSSEANTLTNDL